MVIEMISLSDKGLLHGIEKVCGGLQNCNLVLCEYIRFKDLYSSNVLPDFNQIWYLGIFWSFLGFGFSKALIGYKIRA